MQRAKKEQNTQEINLQVTAALSVTVIPNQKHEFTLTTKELAKGYGVAPSTIHRHKKLHETEIVEGKHYFTAVQNLNSRKNFGKRILWTKAGVIRLGMFIKSEQAKQFRDWAEALILDTLENKSLKPAPLKVAKQRNHNRMSPKRVISILSDVNKVQNHQLRRVLTAKVLGKESEIETLEAEILEPISFGVCSSCEKLRIKIDLQREFIDTLLNQIKWFEKTFKWYQDDANWYKKEMKELVLKAYS